MIFNAFVDVIYYINLDSRPDRRALFEARVMKAGIDQVIRFPAIHMDAAQVDAIPGLVKHEGDVNRHQKVSSCLSHYNVVKEAKERNYKAVAIFEDDAVFCEGFAEKIGPYMDELNGMTDWDIAWLGCSPEPDFHDKSEKCIDIGSLVFEFWSLLVYSCLHHS